MGINLAGIFSRPVLGLEIGASAVKMVELERRGTQFRLNWFAVADVAARTKGNEERWRSQVLHAISTILREKRAVPDRAYAVISGRNVAVKRMVMTDIPRKEIAESVKWEMGEKLPFPVESAIVDYQIGGEFQDKGVKMLDLVAVAAEKQLLDELQNMMREAGVELAGIGAAPVAILNFLRHTTIAEGARVCCIVDIGAESTDIAVVSDGRLIFGRSVPLAGNAVTSSITGALVSDAGQMILDSTQAEKLKCDCGFPLEEQLGDRPDKPKLLMSAHAMRPVLEQLAREIKRSVDYIQRQGVAVERLVLTGGGSRLKNISLFIAKETGIKNIGFPGIEAATANMEIDTARCTQQELAEQLPRLTAVLGAAMGGEEQINFLRTGIKASARDALVKTIVRYGGALAIGCFVILGAANWLRVKHIESTLQRIRNKNEDLKPVLKRLAGLEAKCKQLSVERDMYTQLFLSGIDGANVLARLSKAVPDRITLSSVECTASEENKSIAIAGFVDSKDNPENLLAKFMEDINASGPFSNTRLVSSKDLKEKPGAFTEFRITATINRDQYGR